MSGNVRDMLETGDAIALIDWERRLTNQPNGSDCGQLTIFTTFHLQGFDPFLTMNWADVKFKSN